MSLYRKVINVDGVLHIPIPPDFAESLGIRAEGHNVVLDLDRGSLVVDANVLQDNEFVDDVDLDSEMDDLEPKVIRVAKRRAKKSAKKR